MPVMLVSSLVFCPAIRACNAVLASAGGAFTLVTIDGSPVSVLGAVAPISVLPLFRVLPAMSAACGSGESCQFQNRVRSIFSADGQEPRTASPSTPRVGSTTLDTGGEKPAL